MTRQRGLSTRHTCQIHHRGTEDTEDGHEGRGEACLAPATGTRCFLGLRDTLPCAVPPCCPLCLCGGTAVQKPYGSSVGTAVMGAAAGRVETGRGVRIARN